MNAKLTSALIVTLLGLSAPTGAQELVKDQHASRIMGVQIYRVMDELPYDVLVKPQVGISAMVNEIQNKLEVAHKNGALSACDLTSFQQMVDEVTREVAAIKGQGQASLSLEQRKQLQNCAGELASVGQNINDKLQPYVATALCPDGNCLARTPEALHNQAKQLQRRLKDKISAGVVSADLEKEYKHEIDKLVNIGISTFREGGNIELSSKGLLQLSKRIDGRTALRVAQAQ